MPIDPSRVLSIIREFEEASPDALKEMDRKLLPSIRQTLQEHRRELDKVGGTCRAIS